MIILFIGSYILMIVGMYLFDALIGFGYEFEPSLLGYEKPSLFLVAFFWWISIPILILMKFIRFTNDIKEARIKKQEHQKQIRIAAAREVASALEQVEEEMQQARRL